MTGPADIVHLRWSGVGEKKGGYSPHETVEEHGARHGVDVRPNGAIFAAQGDLSGEAFITASFCFAHAVDRCMRREGRAPHDQEGPFIGFGHLEELEVGVHPDHNFVERGQAAVDFGVVPLRLHDDAFDPVLCRAQRAG